MSNRSQRPDADEEDPFGPYEYVEIGAQCQGFGGECMWNRCTGRASTCRCVCPVCAGDTPDMWGWDGDWPPS